MNEFDDIRPYNDEEAVIAMKRIASNPNMPLVASFVFPDKDTEEVRERLLAVKSVEDFQTYFMDAFNRRVIGSTISEFTYSGLKNISRGAAYTFVSNHRDIVLDASLLAQIMHDSGMNVPEITFGSNLMSDPLVMDIGKCNRMFRVVRKHSSREFLKESRHLSDYMRSVIRGGRSLWIAQRNGRTKDGLDKTDPGLLKMMSLSGNIGEMSIVPVAVSYEYEPCAAGKIAEQFVREVTGDYVKDKDEDLRSIVTGITDYKGRCHISICRPLVCPAGSAPLNSDLRACAEEIDRSISEGFVRMPSHYAALDIINGTGNGRYIGIFKDYCSDTVREAEEIVRSKDVVPDRSRLMDLLLALYAGTACPTR